jgi:hypothetical protein
MRLLYLVLIWSFVIASGTVNAAVASSKSGLKSVFPIDPSLPRLLILGDSLSIGYTPLVARPWNLRTLVKMIYSETTVGLSLANFTGIETRAR